MRWGKCRGGPEFLSDAELPAIAERANTLTYASIGVGAVAVGLGAVTIVTW